MAKFCRGGGGGFFLKDLYYSVRRDHLVQGSHRNSACFNQLRARHDSHLWPEGPMLACATRAAEGQQPSFEKIIFFLPIW